jgi:hypothetical protein
MKIIKYINPLVLFDYVYYRIAYFYEYRFDYEQAKESSGIMILSLLQLFNIVVLVKLIKQFKGSEGVIIYISSCFALLALNYLRYYKIITYNELVAKWDKENCKVRLIKSICVICYFMVSILLLGM